MGNRNENDTPQVAQDLRDSLDRLAGRAFYWLRLEGEARVLSPVLSQRIAGCLDGLLASLSERDFAPAARFLEREQQRVVPLSQEEKTLQPIALLDACERSLVEGLGAGNHTSRQQQAAIHVINSLVHQARRHWLYLCLRQVQPVGTSTGDGKAVAFLSTLSQDLESAADLDTMVVRLFANLQGLIPHEDGQLLLWGPRQETPLVCCANSRLFVGHGGTVDAYSNWVSFQRTPLLVADIGAGPERAEPPPYNSYIGIPLLQGETLVGTLALVSTATDAFGQADLELLTALAPLLSAAIQRVVPEAGQVQDLQQRLEEQNIILTFGREVHAALEEGRIHSLLLFKAMELTDSDAGAVMTVDLARQEYCVQALSGYASDVTMDDALTAEPAMSWDVGVVGWVARTGQVALIPDVRQEKDYLAFRPETHSQLTVPIKWQGEVIGVLNLESINLNAYGEKQLITAETLADQAAVAIGTTRLFDAIQAQRKWLAGLVANLPEGIVVTDRQLNVVLANPASAHFFGLERALPEGVPLLEHLRDHVEPLLQDPQELARFLERTRAQERGIAEGWLDFKELNRRLWLVSAPLWGEEGGPPSGQVILIRDARQEEDSEREKLGFISVVSHELRSPLTSILGYSELLLAREFKRERRQEFVQAIFGQAQHLAGLIEDMLNLSRLSRGRMRMNWSMASFYQVVAGLATQLDALMSEHHRLLIDVSPEAPPFYADRDKVRVVLNNLIGNADKYSPDGGEVTLRAEAVMTVEESEQRQVPTMPPCILVSVQDQGIGIPEEAVPHIFDRFYRADNTMTRQIGGTGLGLTISKALVELHGGSIWVQSREGEGTTFFFTLPLRTKLPGEALEEELDISLIAEDTADESPVR
jgi:signal transduction histidine kinase/putative methionine-R-sulfoxide reductase with GAF domain